MSFMEYRAREHVWKRSRKEQQWQWASLMAAIHNAWMRGKDQPAYTPQHWIGGKTSAGGQIKPTNWTTEEEAHRMMRQQSTEDQKLALRSMISFASGMNQALAEQQHQ